MRLQQSHFLSVLFALPVLLWMPGVASAQWLVHDPGNAVLMVRQLARQAQELQNQANQIQNQVRSLQNEAHMLQGLRLSNFQQAIDAMNAVEQVLKRHCVELQAEGSIDPIGFDVGTDCQAFMQRFRQAYPAPADWPAQTTPQLAQYPPQWTAQQRGAAAKTMDLQDTATANMPATSQRMQQLASASQAAPGQTAAVQVTNQMLLTLSAQLRDAQAATLAHERAAAQQQAADAAEDARQRELVRRTTADANTAYTVQPPPDPFTSTAAAGD